MNEDHHSERSLPHPDGPAVQKCGLTARGRATLAKMELEKRREERRKVVCGLAGIALTALGLLALYPFLSSSHFTDLVMLSPFGAWLFAYIVYDARNWPAYRSHALAKRIRDPRYQCRRLTRLLLAVCHHGNIPAWEIEAAWEALTYAREPRVLYPEFDPWPDPFSNFFLSDRDRQRIKRAEALYRCWKAEYDRKAPERCAAAINAAIERAKVPSPWQVLQEAADQGEAERAAAKAEAERKQPPP